MFTPLLFSAIGLILWVILVINTYYSTDYSSVDHLSSSSGWIQPIWGAQTSFSDMVSSPFGVYIISLLMVYIGYKSITLFFMGKDKIQFGVFSVIGFFLLHLAILCAIYASMPEGKQMNFGSGISSGGILFFHILSLLLYPVILTIISRACGYAALDKLIPRWSERDLRVTILADVAIGFLILSTLLLLLASMGWYTLTGLIVLLVGMSVIGWQGLKKTYTDALDTSVSYDNHEAGKGLYELARPHLLTTEFSFLTLTFVMSVALISIIRPMPIGWDDLGVYMNYPKILALTGESMKGVAMYSWQLITGTGFMFSYNAAQAFFVNQLGSILAVVAIALGLSVIFQSPGKKHFISLPLLLATIYYVMPMTVFHHTKDMKLDPGLLFVSISALMVFFSFVSRKAPSKEKTSNELFSILALIGILIGFAFTIKLTSLMLLVGIFGLFAYRLLSFWGYLGFFFTFLAVFTGGNLWSMLNVWMPADTSILYSIAGGLLALGLISFTIAFVQKTGNNVFHYIIGSIVLFLAFIVGVSPWIMKNTLETRPWDNAKNLDTKTLIMSSVFSGSGAYFQADFTKIMSTEEYDKKVASLSSTSINCDGQSGNEDFGRYFGYEKGINNYLRLPLNLSFQKNQGGEFTSITYIFLALIPVLFLFARGRYPWAYTSIVTIGILTLFAYGFMGPSKGNDDAVRHPVRSMLERTYTTIVANDTYRTEARATTLSGGGEVGESIKIAGTYVSDFWNLLIKKPILEGLYRINAGSWITDKLSLKECNINAAKTTDKYPLLSGYLILVLINIFFLAVVHFLTRDEEEDASFRDMNIMLGTYGFLFLISAFGIVWYGIFVYFIFFALIGILSKSFNTFDTHDTGDTHAFSIKTILAIFLFISIALYITRTAIPHAWTNLRGAGSASNEYKYLHLNQEEALFSYRNDYFVPVATMNLRDTSVLTGAIQKVSSPKLREMLTSLSSDKAVFLEGLSQLIPQAQRSKDATLRKDGHNLAEFVYKTVLYPSKEQANTDGIYRIGTFMTYLIHKNSTRYYEDNLVFAFETFFYDKSPEKTIEKMQKLGLKFLLIDLNAATIDRDPKRVLTQRYEHLLLSMRAKNLKLVDTDNICLRLALDEYRNGKLQTEEEFINIAGTNYESYRSDASGALIPVGRGQKQKQCYNYILESIYKGDGATKYPYLNTIKESITANNATNNPELIGRILSNYAGQSFFALYEITDMPVTQSVVVTPVATGSTQTGTTR